MANSQAEVAANITGYKLVDGTVYHQLADESGTWTPYCPSNPVIDSFWTLLAAREARLLDMKAELELSSQRLADLASATPTPSSASSDQSQATIRQLTEAASEVIATAEGREMEYAVALALGKLRAVLAEVKR